MCVLEQIGALGGSTQFPKHIGYRNCVTDMILHPPSDILPCQEGRLLPNRCSYSTHTIMTAEDI